MITPCARVMAVATFATTRCGSFLYGGARFARTGAKQFAALHSSAQVEQTTKDHESLSRSNADDASLDSVLISTNPDLVVDHMKARRMGEDSVEAVHRIGDLMDNRRELIMTKEDALKQRNAMSAQIGKLMKAGQAKEAEEKKNEVQSINKIAGSAEEDLNEVDSELNTLLMRLPNLLDSRVPDGDGEEENVVVAEWGQEYIKNGEEYLWHDEVAIKLGGWDPEGAARISGARFSVLKGPLARLERALGQWLLDVHTTEHGYTEVSLPLLVTRSSLEGTGQLPKFEEDLFKTNHLVANEDSFLIPTGEVPLTNLLRGQLLDKAQLPMSLVALTPCFRAEAGSAGRDTRGLLRQHQFLKVELVKFTTPEDSRNEHEALTQHAEAVLKALKLPFRRVSLCSGDIGFGARLCYDLEVWMPGQGAFREISSCSNCQDFQARRMNLRYREPTPEAKKKKSRNLPCHTINGSGVAVGRALVAVLENYYNPIDGSVSIPDVLRPYMGGAEKLESVPQ
ncbi:conserved unknown protein [Ectocarpus siliculosus]|uniref:Serine--tRNA ligase n=1 Tax=Ectocarpus siliculosus TaxID=2880 RepID=D8LRT5_ECTSI|nr:conserved unknown protein [Ectocarpus siliculosus]|eukprot:CBN73852.1 conserved unknown protein [Ectocarpus siliculosus]